MNDVTLKKLLNLAGEIVKYLKKWHASEKSTLSEGE